MRNASLLSFVFASSGAVALAAGAACSSSSSPSSGAPAGSTLDASLDAPPDHASSGDAGASSDAGAGATDGARALGAFIGEPNETFPTSAGALTYYAGEVGRMPAVVLWYTGLDKAFDTASFDAVRAAGAVPMITLQPGGTTPTPNTFPLKELAMGMFDTQYVIPWAQAARAWGHPFFLRFAHEMNTATTYPWGTAPGNPNGNVPADYVAAWQHVHEVFEAQQATNAIWVFCPAGGGSNLLAIIPQDYPGDTYVDWLCFDSYNRGTQGTDGWQSMLQTLEPAYGAVAALSPSKPVMVGETSSVEDGGDKAQWITQGFLQDLPAHLPRIRLVTWFDAIHTDQKGATFDWRIDSSDASLSAYESVVATPQWQGTAP